MNQFTEQSLFDALKQLEVLDEKVLTDTFDQSQKENTSFSELLIKNDLISDENLGKVIADIYSLPFVKLKTTAIKVEDLSVVPEVYARHNTLICFKVDDSTIHIATNKPENKSAISMLEKKTGKAVKVYYATPSDLLDTFSQYDQDAKSAFQMIIQDYIDKAQKVEGSEPPIIKIVDTIIEYGYKNDASDIHIEPTEDHSLVRFRIDGVLHDIAKLPDDIHKQIVTRIKVMANLRTDEHHEAQDGKITFKTEREDLDLRVSVVPVTKGENIVMRLLSEKSREFALEELGIENKDLKKVELAYKSPHGMVLATGPTGSGKTTTLYAILRLLDKREVNIMTIEDPVEYDMENVNQIQVNEETNLTFAEGLRSIVRQDPDIVLVGEIRDEETAGIAVNSAMTGHLVLSTLHTNDAATTIPRLIEMKVQPFLVASTINVIIAQRLVRKICTKCRTSIEMSKSSESKKMKEKQLLSSEIEKKLFGGKATIRLYKGKGCDVCHNTGYQGRIGIFEILTIDDEIRNAITEKKDASVIEKLAIKNGMTTIQDDGIEKVKKGITTLEEVMRVTSR